MLKFSITIILAAVTLFVSAQNGGSVVEKIKADYRHINTYPKFHLVHIDKPSGLTTDGGEELTGYFRGDTLCKITYFLGLSFTNRHVEYYLNDGQVFFIYETKDHFAQNNDTGELDYNKITRQYEARYYVAGGEVVKRSFEGKVKPDPLSEIYSPKKIAEFRRILIKKRR